MKKTAALLCALMLFAYALCSCSGESNISATPTQPPAVSEVSGAIDTTFSDSDRDGSFDMQVSTSIMLGDSVIIEGAGAASDGSSVTISDEGTYVVTGEFNGQIIVDAEKTDKVQLVLAGTAIEANAGAAINVLQADKVFITAYENTENTLADNAATNTDETDACIYSADDLTINGAGTLTVNGNFRHGILSKDDLTVCDTKLFVTSVSDGLRGKDCVKMTAATVSVSAGSDGIQSNNSEDTSLGYVYISECSLDITVGCDGVQAQTALEICGGRCSIISGGGSENVAANGRVQTAEESAKGLKADTVIKLCGGTYVLDTRDDAIHAGTDAWLEPESIMISSGDDGVHSDANLVISGGSIAISKSYEGLEGTTITVSDGKLDIVASDDGMNAAGGADGSSVNGRPGQNHFDMEGNEDCFITISGGNVSINAGGDGIDSNGSIFVSGGCTTVAGPTNNGNGALDYAINAQISGGTLIASGSSGMAQGMSDTSSQCSVLIYFSKAYAAGDEIVLKAKDGTEIVKYLPSKAFSSVLISCPELTQGETVMLSCADTQLCEIELAGNANSVSDNGSAVSNHGGGGRP